METRGFCLFVVPTGEQPKFQSFLDPRTGALSLFVPDRAGVGGGKRLLVCGQRWDMAAANVACKDHGHPL